MPERAGRKSVMLVFDSGTIEGSITEWPAVLCDGTLEIDGEASENIIPIPLDRRGSIQLTLKPSFMDDPIVVRGNHVHLELQGAPIYVEKFSGSSSDSPCDENRF
jgi:hypothetical protein